MEQFQRGLNVMHTPQPANMAEQLKADKFNLDTVLPLEAVREHTKTDDVPAVTDMMLRLYRKAAFEAAQEYTGLMLLEQRIVTEDVRPPVFTHRGYNAATFTHRLQYAAAQNFLWYYGLKGQPAERVAVQPGTNTVQLPQRFDSFGLGCCNPCADTATARVQYVAGLGCVDDIPAAILLGVLKYIAHVVENPGDMVVASNTGGGTVGSSLTVSQPANPAWASGAIEIWRVVKRDAI